MRFDLVRPCANCPFRSDAWFQTTVTNGDGDRQIGEHSQHCAGALILHEKAGRPNWRIRLAQLLGLYNPDRLDLTAPVFDTEAQFVKSCTSRRPKT